MQKIIDTIKEHKVIAICRGVSRENLISAAEALYEGGIRLMEVTYSANGAVTDEDTAENIRILAEYFGEKMFIGAGTVLTERQVVLTKEAGGRFIISPNTDIDVIRKTKELGLVSIPGSLTPTEAVVAHKAGADFVKLFPAGTFGPSYVKAVKAPLSHVDVLAVGGIDENNAAAFLAAGACGVGVGGNLVNNSWIKVGEFEKVKEVATKMVAAVK